MTTPLSSLERGALRADAHILHPVVTVSVKGLTESVLAEIDRALKSHELIKVKASTDDRELRAGWMKEICAKLEAHPIQSIGKVLVIYRERPPEPKKRPPPRGAAAAHSYFTSTISYTLIPPGVRTSATSPSLLPIIALAIGEE